MRITWQPVCNQPDVITLHIDSLIPDLWATEDSAEILANPIAEAIQDVAERAGGNFKFIGKALNLTAFHTDLREVRGICDVSHYNNYAIQFTKGTVFDWSEVQPRILSILCDALSEDVSSVTVREPPKCAVCDDLESPEHSHEQEQE